MNMLNLDVIADSAARAPGRLSHEASVYCLQQDVQRLVFESRELRKEVARLLTYLTYIAEERCMNDPALVEAYACVVGQARYAVSGRPAGVQAHIVWGPSAKPREDGL